MGRYNNTPRTERICTNCMRNEIEDEEHFILLFDVTNSQKKEKNYLH